MSKALENYLISIGHNGSYRNSEYQCSCANNSGATSAPLTIKESSFVRSPITTTRTPKVSTTTIKVAPSTGGAYPKVATPIASNVQSRIDISTPTDYRPGLDPSEYGILNPLLNPVANSDLLTPTIENTGILPPVFTTENTLQESIANLNPISQTGAQQEISTEAGKNTKAGTWFLGLLAVGFIARKLMKGDTKKK